jgi:hypothetical protein
MRPRAIIDNMHRVLSVAETARKCDAVFVLAGNRQRKLYGVELYRQGYAPRILLSVGRFEIRRFRELPLPYPAGSEPIDLLAAAQPIAPPERHFFVTFSSAEVSFERIGAGRLGTLHEIQALAMWRKQRPEVHSLVVVSSGYHLRRVRMCCRALLPKAMEVTYAAAPEQAGAAVRVLLLEFVKLSAYAVVLGWVKICRRPR